VVRGDGILLADKPSGPTSFAVVQRVRRALLSARRQEGHYAEGHGRQRYRCGHAGSLDPLASGLLLLLCGGGTRLSPFLMGLDKAYRCEFRFGVGTDSHDAEGAEVARVVVSFAPEELRRRLADFTGDLAQVPPAYSAIKRDGQRLYALARRGAALPVLAPRAIRVSRFELLEARWGGEAPPDAPAAADGRIYDAAFLVECSSGTYVRALARDLARSLGCEAHVRSLRRERIGPFVVTDAVPAARLDDGAALTAAMCPLGAALPHLPALTVTALEAAALRRGEQPAAGWLRRLDRPLATPAGEEVFLQARDANGGLVAVLRIPAAGGLPRSAAVFPEPGREEPPCT